MPSSVPTLAGCVDDQGGLAHVILRLREEIHGAQLWVDTFLPGVVRVRHTLPGFRAVALACPPAALEALCARAEVVSAHADLEVRGCLESSVAAVRAPALWEEGLTGKGVRLAVLDTGIDRGHPDFEGRIAAFADFTGLGVRDDSGHGTFVASVAAGSGEASRGRYRGVAPAASLLVARVLDSSATGRESDVMAGLAWAAALEARVVNLSLGTPGAAGAGDALAWAVDECVARGVAVCVAAGPGGAGSSPGAAANAIVVESFGAGAAEAPAGAARREDAPLAAPGQDVIAARAYGTNVGRECGPQYCAAGGTSAAAAHASGVCALLLEAAPEATPAQLALSLRAGARALADGRGAIQALAALADLRERLRRPGA